MAIATVNPATGQVLESFAELSDAELEERLARAAATFATYRLTSFEQRASWLEEAASILDSDAEAIARCIVLEMGKTIGSARAEVAKCARGCRHYAARAESYLADEQVEEASVGASRAYARYQPLGAVLAVMPWNYPLWQVIRFAAPALMAGNVGLLKHASNVPRTALRIESLFERAGFPPGAFQSLLVGSARIGSIIEDPRVAAVTLTGSGPAGSSVASIAGRAVKPSVLELGGSDPFIVMPSADLDAAASIAVAARFQNNGQSCIAAKRFIVHDAVADGFEMRFVAAASSLAVGDPLEEATMLGPLATEAGRAELDGLVVDAVSKGARVLCGGKARPGPGWFYEPTVLTALTPEMTIFLSEAFGPVASLYRVRDIDEAIELANATDLGLGANAWTSDLGEADRFVRDLEAGAVFVNGMVTSFPELPFGGVKSSGYGRELSAQGIRTFCNLKTVWIGAPPVRGELDEQASERNPAPL